MPQVTGIIIEILEEKIHTDNFKTREFVVKIDYNKEFPQELPFQFSNQRCELLKDFPLGIMVTVDFSYKGKSYIDSSLIKKRFITFDAWKLTRVH